MQQPSTEPQTFALEVHLVDIRQRRVLPSKGVKLQSLTHFTPRSFAVCMNRSGSSALPAGDQTIVSLLAVSGVKPVNVEYAEAQTDKIHTLV